MTTFCYKGGEFDNDKPGSNNAGKLCALHITEVKTHIVD